MASLIPSEDEIRRFAKEIGAVDEDGNYTEPRAKLAKGALAWRDELANLADQPDGEPASWTTAEQLRRFSEELTAAGFTRVAAAHIVRSATHALIDKQGLQLKPKESPANE